MNESKWFNFRPIFFVFVIFAFGIIFANFCSMLPIVFGILTFLIFSAIVFISVKYRQVAIVIVGFICFLSGIFSFYVCKNNYNEQEHFDGNSQVSGTIEFFSKQQFNYQHVYLNNLTIDEQEVNGVLMLKIRDYANAEQFSKVGNILSFQALIKNCSLYQFDKQIPSTFLLDNNIKYASEAYANTITKIGEDVNFAQKIKNTIYDNLHLGLTNENAELVYSALFGDKTNLTSDYSNIFSASGIAHLLAVSGLHIGIIVALLLLVMSLLKINKKVQIIILIPILLFYAYLCNFSISVLRAIIMTALILIAPVMLRRYDTLCSLSLAGIITLIISPMNVFSASWILSFGSIFSIACFYLMFKELLNKTKLNKKLNQAIAISLSAQIGTIIPLIFYFKQLQPLALISNIIAIPIFSIGFSIAYVIAFLSLLLPFLSYLLYVINPLFYIVKAISAIISGISFSVIYTSEINYFSVLLSFLMMTVLGKYFLKDNLTKIATFCVLISIFVVNSAVMVYY